MPAHFPPLHATRMLRFLQWIRVLFILHIYVSRRIRYVLASRGARCLAKLVTRDLQNFRAPRTFMFHTSAICMNIAAGVEHFRRRKNAVQVNPYHQWLLSGERHFSFHLTKWLNSYFPWIYDYFLFIFFTSAENRELSGCESKSNVIDRIAQLRSLTRFISG